MLVKDQPIDPARARAHGSAVGTWESEGVGPDGVPLNLEPTIAGNIGDAEAGNLRVRLIALENLVVALLANGPERQSDLVREMAGYISPRQGATPHRLTLEAARNMLALLERAEHYKSLDRSVER